MLRVVDLERSIHFYEHCMGMRLLRRKDYPKGRFTLAFLGYGDESTETALELTHNWDKSEYSLGTAYGHIAIQVPDVYAACDEIQKKGGEISRAPGPMAESETILAFVRDPDGYLVELLQRD
tara:strand:- start:141 stop:506 length:366 start_codon:yes stop_codon:yes gene_type:complete